MDTGKLKQKTKEISFEITGGNIPATQIMPLIYNTFLFPEILQELFSAP